MIRFPGSGSWARSQCAQAGSTEMPGRCGPAISCVRAREFCIGRHQVQYAVKRPRSVLSMTSHSMTEPIATARCTRPAVRNSRCAALQPGVRTGNRNRPSRFSGAAGGSRHCRSHPCQVWCRGWSAGTAAPDPRPRAAWSSCAGCSTGSSPTPRPRAAWSSRYACRSTVAASRGTAHRADQLMGMGNCSTRPCHDRPGCVRRCRG